MSARKLSELAAKARRDPYELDPEDGGPVVALPQPTIAQWQEACQALTLEGFLSTMGASAADVERLGKVMPDQDLGTEGVLIADMRKHFGLGN